MDTDVNDPLAMVAMQIILHAGDAHTKVTAAYRAAAAGELDAAQQSLDEALVDIRHAHRAQTELIQQEAAGNTQTLTVLFVHAQDTLMTVKSEHAAAQGQLAIWSELFARIDALEGKAK